MSFSDRLKQMDQKYRDRKARNFSEFPDGTFTFQLENAKIIESKKDQKIYVVWTHFCVDGGPAGETFEDLHGLENEKTWPFLMRRITALGADAPDSLMDVEEVIETLAESKPKYTASIVSKGGYQNIYVKELVEAVSAPWQGDPKPPASAKAEPEEAPPKAEEKPKRKRKAEPKAEPKAAEIDDEMKKKGALICQSFDIAGITDDSTVEEIRKELNGGEWDVESEGLAKDEVATLEAFGCKVTGK